MQPRDQIYVKDHTFLCFAKNMSKRLSIKYGQKLLDTTKKFAMNALKDEAKKVVQKITKATGNLVRNKIIDSCFKKYP